MYCTLLKMFAPFRACPTTIIIICLDCISFFENSALTTFLSRMLCHADNTQAICDLEVPGSQCYRKEMQARPMTLMVVGHEPQSV